MSSFLDEYCDKPVPVEQQPRWEVRAAPNGTHYFVSIFISLSFPISSYLSSIQFILTVFFLYFNSYRLIDLLENNVILLPRSKEYLYQLQHLQVPPPHL